MLAPDRVDEFGKAVRAALRSKDNRAFARAYVHTLVSEVVVSEDEFHIKGPYAALIKQASIFAAKGVLLPAFALQWRTRQDSNL